MKQNFLLSIVFIVLLLSVQSAYTNRSVPPTGHTGAPSENTCNTAGCHTGSAVVTNSSFLAVTSATSTLFTDGYTPGQTYDMIINLSSSTPRYGFELTVLDNLNDNAAGTLSLTPSTTTTTLNSNGGRQYVSHLNANSTAAWTFKWQAPAAGTDTVVFYVAGNASNANGNTQGDVIHSNSFKLHERVQQPVTGCNEIFISEYVEGSGFNKALELYNPTANPIDLSGYRLAQYNNGSATPGVFSTLSGIIQPYDTRVLVLDKRTGSPPTDAALAAKADTFMNPTNTAEVLYFNGDDAIVLQRLNGTVVDIFGKIGQDPGTGWSSSGTNYTANHTLVRRPTVTQGVTTSPTTFDPQLEWILYASDFFDSLGTHTSVCSPTFCTTLQLTATPTNALCNGGATGSVALNAIGGTGVYTFNSTPTSNLAATTYTYIVTDDFGCADTTTATVTQPTALVLNVTDQDLSCGVNNSGKAFAALTGGTPPYTFAWSGGTPNGAGDTITGLAAGAYTVTATDDNGCTATSSVTLTAPVVAQQPASITGSASVCLGSETYSVPTQSGVVFTWAVSGGGTITPSANQANINWTAAGTYTVSVTASSVACGNAPVQTLQVTVSATPTVPVVSGDAVACLPATETYTVPAVNGVTYNWTLSTGGTLTPNTNSATVIWATAGSHTISVTATNQCGTNGAGTFAVNVGNPTVSLGNDTAVCGQYGLSTSGFTSTTWSTGANTSQITVTQSGNYGVTVTDNLGCTASDAVNVTINTIPTLTLPATASDCDTAVVTAPGNFATYAWSNGQNTALGSFTQNGTYTLTATDANGCSASDDVTVTIFAEPVTGLPASASDCNTVSVSAAAGFASYLWSDGQTTQTASFTAAATYSLTVTDGNGCQGVGSVVVTLLSNNPTAGFTFVANQLDVDFTSTSTGASSYAWDFGDGTSSTDQNPSVTYTADGSYVVTLTATNNCGSDTFTDTVTVLTIGVTELAGVNALEVYPNPTNSQLQVRWGATQGTATIEVWNTLGMRMQTIETDAINAAHTLNVQDLASGIYLLRIQLGTESKLVKFVKE